ncbi:helix-turn-helix domain-containing protein [Leucobacter rhizosphaerae]|uniref:Helix-turn-helix domain-containing protein n=1 Tax=Leucobacter rhizosphaerae TaxID=2932245 RepID=A0ABY4FVN1_9MICO|nr:helix-turn-helix transcriptional regulator [Leucobacter rhizosphaerae]UOQ60345.1 helix-turn-helix domain-containing protein [Leucobacter rhizosphaerae]
MNKSDTYSSNPQASSFTNTDTCVVQNEQYDAYMNNRQRSETFARYLGLELKGKIIRQGHTAKSVADAIGRSPAAFNRWLNGKVEIPLSVFVEACEAIDLEPQGLVEDAYSRLCFEFGERDGFSYPAEPESNVIVGGFGQNAELHEDRLKRVADSVDENDESGEDQDGI